jgi:hypothetical protein
VGDKPISRVRALLRGVRDRADGTGFDALCPAHEADGERHRPSLSVSTGRDGCVLMKCHAGCTVEAVLAALGLTVRDLFPGHAGGNGRRIAATYDYQDEAGCLRFQTVRYHPKDFRQRRPDGKGGWAWDLRGVERLLYRLPELVNADPSAPVFVCEGEKDVERLRSLGLVATCNPMGAGKWQQRFNGPLRGRHVIVIPDNDDAGRNHARQVAESLNGAAASVTTLELPGLPDKGDVSDWLNKGGTKERLLELVREARGEAGPDPQQTNGEGPGPAPEGPRPWEGPLPLGAAPSAAAFPVDVLPGAARRLVEEAADAIHCPPDYVAVPALVLAGAAAGAARKLQVKPGRQLQPNLYAAVIGGPSGGKTPALRMAATPLYRLQGELHATYLHELAEHEDRLTRREKGEAKPPRPVERKVLVGDCTVEKMGGILYENPRGVAKVHDELTALVAAMNQYKAGKGADRQFYLSAWAGEPVMVDRKGQLGGSVFVERPFLAVVGGLVPDLLHMLRGERFVADGWLDRFLLSYPAGPQAVAEDWRCLNDGTAQAWQALLADLRGAPEHVARLTACGRQAWEGLTGRLAAEMNGDGFPDCLRGPWGKFRDHAPRLALILQLLRLSARETDSEDVDGESVERAERLVVYFQSHARKVYLTIDADPRVADARRVLARLPHSVDCVETVDGVRSVSRRDLHVHVLGGGRALEETDAIITLLLKHGYFRPLVRPERQGAGRKPSPAYEVHPCVFTP